MNVFKLFRFKDIAWRYSLYKKRIGALMWLRNHQDFLNKRMQQVPSFQFRNGREFKVMDDTTAHAVFSEIYINHDYKMSQSLKRRKLIVDLGANVGLFSFYAHLKNPKAVIYALEANPDTFSVLKQNIKENHLSDSVKPVLSAISDANGEISLYVPNVTGGASIYSSEAVGNQVKVNISSTTFSSFCRTQKIENVDYFKIDIEGAEYPAILGDPGFFDVTIREMVLETDEIPRNSHYSLADLEGCLKSHFESVKFPFGKSKLFLIHCKKARCHADCKFHPTKKGVKA